MPQLSDNRKLRTAPLRNRDAFAPVGGMMRPWFGVWAALSLIMGATPPARAEQKICSAVVIVENPRLSGGSVSTLRKGETIRWLTSTTHEDGNLFFCQWMGDCFDGRDIKLKEIMETYTNRSASWISETDRISNTRETGQKCPPNYLR
jgi:hypothetical protein